MNSLGGLEKIGSWHLTGLSRNHTKCHDYIDDVGNPWKVVRLWNTDIVKWSSSGIVELNTGGHHTSTTKRRMNDVSYLVGLGYQVYQENYQWYVLFEGIKYPFVDHMRLYRGIEDRTRKEVVREVGLFG